MTDSGWNRLEADLGDIKNNNKYSDNGEMVLHK